MAALDDLRAARPPRGTLAGWRNRLLASPRFQAWAAASPLARRRVRREGEALFDLVAGFCHSQALAALVGLDVPGMLLDGPMEGDALARRVGVPPERMRVLLRAGAALGLVSVARGGRYALTMRGAALHGVPGLADMIAHHRALYRDLEDPVAFFRDGSSTELAAFWPYVHGAAAAGDAGVAARYSDLMARSQALVAEDTLGAVPLDGVRRLLDVGGGTGAFLEAAGRRHPRLEMVLLDLPAVAPAARQRLDAAGLGARATIVPGSFRDAPLPEGCDAISLVRVLYDHADPTVAALLAAAHAALPPGGLLVVSEPMTGGDRPERAGDAYFALYTLAMGTGRARAPVEIAALCRGAGFEQARRIRTPRPFVTSIVTARKPGAPRTV